MRQTASSSPRRLSILLVAALMAALALPCLAAATPSAPVPTADASFVASLAAPAAPALQPAPIFLQTGTSCTNNSQCPPGKLCCRACAFPGCTAMACLTPMNGHCPLIP